MTVKYSPDGVQLWASLYDGPASGDDSASAIAVDSHGNSYVTGGSRGASTGGDIATVKYDSAGNQLWAARYNGIANGDDFGTAVVADSSGNVYVTGDSTQGDGSFDCVTIKYDPSGQQLWERHYANSRGGAAVLDGAGNLHIAGFTDTGVLALEYDNAGNQLWATLYNDPDYPAVTAAIRVDAAGNTIIAERLWPFVPQFAPCDLVTIKLDPAGNILWVNRFSGNSNGAVFRNGLAVDAVGNSYVVDEADRNYVTIKYDPSGRQLWAATNNDPATVGQAVGVVVDSAENAYVVGGAGVVKYDASGHQVWATLPGAPVSGAFIALDSNADIYVTGGKVVKLGLDDAPPIFSAPVNGTDGAGHKTISFTVQDAQCGLASVSLLKATNCTVTLEGYLLGVGGSFEFGSPPAPTAPAHIVATKINQSLSATVSIQATDVCGHSAVLDPVMLTLTIPRGKSSVSRTVSVPDSEHFLTALNGDPGVRELTTYVNGTRLRSGSDALPASQSLAASFHKGRNAVMFIAKGKPGDSVTVILGDGAGGVAHGARQVQATTGNSDWGP